MVSQILQKIPLRNPERKSRLNDSSNSQSSDTNYQNLEHVLQKYEAEIRDHIRIEQQLKIYTESLEQELFQLKKKRETHKNHHEKPQEGNNWI